MITLILVDIAVIIQSQITDYLKDYDREDRTIKRYVRLSVTRTILAAFRKQKKAKVLDKSRRLRKEFPIQTTLDKWVQIIHVPKVLTQPTPIYHQIITQQSQITQFLPVKDVSNEEIQIIEEHCAPPYLTKLPYNFFDRFPSIPSVTQEMFCHEPLLADAWKYYQEVDNFTGLFQHMIILNCFEYWDEVEQDLRQDGFHPKGFTVKEFVIWEFFRHSRGIADFEQAYEMFSQFDTDLLAQIFIHPKRIPQPFHASYYYQWLKPAHFHKFLQRLVAECVHYGIIVPKILMADGLFVRSAAGNFSLDKYLQPTDPAASRTVHNNRYFGKGFMGIVFCAWCRNRWLPVDIRVFSGSISENKYFKPTVADFLCTTPYEWEITLYDTGGCGEDNRIFLKDQGHISGITARSNIKKEAIIQLGANRYAYWEDIPDKMSIHMYQRLLEHRAQEEAVFSPFTTVFNMKRMNQMGWNAAMIHYCQYLSLLLLHALTAYKVNADRLVMNAKAFTNLN